MNNVEMARPAQKPNVKKSQVGSSQLDQQIITGVLTSRIETRDKEGKSYYYGFFKISQQEQETPVIFKVKPDLKRGSSIKLEGNWAKSNHSRPSFTCQTYQILKDPPTNQVQINCFYNSKFSRVVLPPRKARLWKNTIKKSIVPKLGR